MWKLGNKQKLSSCRCSTQVLTTRFVFAAPNRIGLNELMRHKSFLTLGESLEVVDPQPSNLCLFFSSYLSYYNCQPAFWSYSKRRFSFGMGPKSLFIKPLSYKCFRCKKQDCSIIRDRTTKPFPPRCSRLHGLNNAVYNCKSCNKTISLLIIMNFKILPTMSRSGSNP